MERNVFDYAFSAMEKAKAKAKAKASKKPGCKEMQVNQLAGDEKEVYAGGGGSRRGELGWTSMRQHRYQKQKVSKFETRSAI